MTIIDFHLHIFPDKLAFRVIPMLAEKASIPNFTDGTLSDTLRNMDEVGIDKGVMLSIATNAKQQKNVNDFAIATNSERIIAFGSVFPFADNAIDELERIRIAGLKGIKLHAEYQGFKVDDKAIFPVYEYCAQNGMIISFHSGVDYGYKNQINCPPDGLLKVSKAFPNLKMVCAHMGGFEMWDDVLKYTAGRENVWFDTSFTGGYITEHEFMDIFNRHGSERILFGTDSPWSSGKPELDFLKKLPIKIDELQNILGKNAQKLLGI